MRTKYGRLVIGDTTYTLRMVDRESDGIDVYVSDGHRWDLAPNDIATVTIGAWINVPWDSVPPIEHAAPIVQKLDTELATIDAADWRALTIVASKLTATLYTDGAAIVAGDRATNGDSLDDCRGHISHAWFAAGGAVAAFGAVRSDTSLPAMAPWVHARYEALRAAEQAWSRAHYAAFYADMAEMKVKRDANLQLVTTTL